MEIIYIVRLEYIYIYAYILYIYIYVYIYMYMYIYIYIYIYMWFLLLFMLHCLCHWVKSVQIRSIFWSVFSCIQSEYKKLWTRKNSVFRHFLHRVYSGLLSIVWSLRLLLFCRLFWPNIVT